MEAASTCCSYPIYGGQASPSIYGSPSSTSREEGTGAIPEADDESGREVDESGRAVDESGREVDESGREEGAAAS